MLKTTIGVLFNFMGHRDEFYRVILAGTLLARRGSAPTILRLTTTLEPPKKRIPEPTPALFLTACLPERAASQGACRASAAGLVVAEHADLNIFGLNAWRPVCFLHFSYLS
jgi:hypothetical protein